MFDNLVIDSSISLDSNNPKSKVHVNLNNALSLLGDADLYCIENEDDYKREILTAIKIGDIGKYEILMEALGRSIDYKKMFSSNDGCPYFDAPVIGNYFEYIPKNIISQFKLIKISTSEENRINFCKAKKWNPDFLKRLDYFYKDPPYWDEEIII
jgi:hypothetical protein